MTAPGAPAPDLDGAVTALLEAAHIAVLAAQWARGEDADADAAAWLLGKLQGHHADAAKALGVADLGAVRDEVETAALAIVTGPAPFGVTAFKVTAEDEAVCREAFLTAGEPGDEWPVGLSAALRTLAARLAVRHAAPGADGAVEAEIVCHDDQCGHAIESHGDGGCMVLGCAVDPYGGPCEATYVDTVAPSVPSGPPTQASALEAAARLVRELSGQAQFNVHVFGYPQGGTYAIGANVNEAGGGDGARVDGLAALARRLGAAKVRQANYGSQSVHVTVTGTYHGHPVEAVAVLSAPVAVDLSPLREAAETGAVQ